MIGQGTAPSVPGFEGMNCMRKGSSALVVVCTAVVWPMALPCAVTIAGEPAAPIRLGHGLQIVGVHPGKQDAPAVAGAAPSYSFPRPRLVGFSPLVAIATSSKRSAEDIHYEHFLESTYDCNPNVFGGFCGALNPPADQDFVVGVLDSGAVVDLAAGSAALQLGLTGAYLTENVVPIGGVGGSVNGYVTYPVGIYAAGLGSVDPATGILELSGIAGHSNTCAVVAPPIDCGAGEVLSAVIGTPFLSFFNAVIRVDMPRERTIGGRTYAGPDVQIQSPFDPIPEFPRAFSMQAGGFSPVTTASYYPDLEDLSTPMVPTALSFSALSFPTGAVFFSTVRAVEGEPGPTNPLIEIRMMVDTGAQTSIISSGIAADMGLPFDPDFTVDACGIGGLIEDIPGYYIDYVKISGFGGALEFSRVPVVVLDLESPEGGPLDGVLGMNLFWDRNVIFEPSLTTSAFFHVSDPVPVAFGDTDVNLRVDSGDAAFFVGCRTGPQGLISPECDHLDGDLSGGIDLADFAAFQNCYSGPLNANPSCAE